LSVAREKDTGKLDEEILLRFADRAQVPKVLVADTAIQTLKDLTKAWKNLASELPLGQKAREKIEAQFRYVPLMRAAL